MQGRDQAALPKALGLRFVLPASPVPDRNRAGRKCISRTGRGEPSAGQSREVEERFVPIRSKHSNEHHQSREMGSCSAKSALTYYAKNRNRRLGRDSPNRWVNRARE